MKILIPILSYGKAGGIKVLCNLANYWSKNGHDVAFVMPAILVEHYYPIDCKIITVDKYGHESTVLRHMNSIDKVLSISRYLYKYSKNYNSIIANHNLTAYPVAFFSKTNNYYYIQAYEPEFSNEIIRNPLKKYFYKTVAWCSYFLPLIKIVNADIYKDYKNISAKYVVYPGINIQNFYPKKRSFKKTTDKFYIGCIGRLETWKGSNDVGEAIRLLHQKGYNNIELVVAFNPITYTKHTLVKPDGEIALADYYRSLDILVTAGQIQLDAIHYPVIEALITKTPLITTGYFPSSEKNSTLIQVKSPVDIAEKIENLILNYELAVAKSELDFDMIANQFSWPQVSNNFISILKLNNMTR